MSDKNDFIETQEKLEFTMINKYSTPGKNILQYWELHYDQVYFNHVYVWQLTRYHMPLDQVKENSFKK